MAYNLTFTPAQWPGHVPFVDTDHLRFIRGGLTIDAAQVNADRLVSQGQAALVNGRLTLLQGSYISENPGTGRYEMYVPAVAWVAAALSIGAGNAIVTVTALAVGAAGNDIQVVFINPGANDQALSCTYAGGIIFVSLATGPAGAITSTAALVIAAINAAAGADVLATDDGAGGAGVVAAAALAPLAGGVDGNTAVAAGLRTGISDLETAINWRSAVPGVGGNAVTIAYTDPLAINQALAVAAPGGNIVVSLATDATGAVTSTAAEIVAAALLVGAVTAVAVPELACAIGNGVVAPMAATTMTGGIAAGAANIANRYACMLFEDVTLVDGQGALADAIATGIDHGRVTSARLPLAPDATVRAALPSVVFK